MLITAGSINSPIRFRPPLPEAVITILNPQGSPLLQRTHQYAYRALMIVVVIPASALAKVPYAPISWESGHIIAQNILSEITSRTGHTFEGSALGDTLGILCTAGNSISFFVLEVWAASGVIERLLRTPLCNLSRKQVAVYTVGGVLIVTTAAASQLTPTLAGVEYNSPALKTAAATVLLVCGSLLPVESLCQSVQAIRNLSCAKLRAQLPICFQAPQAKIKEHMALLIEQDERAFLALKLEDKFRLLQIFNQANSQERLQVLLESHTKLDRERVVESKTRSAVRQICHYTGFTAGTALTGIFQYASAAYAYSKSKVYISDNEGSAILFGAAAGFASLWLMGDSLAKTTQRAFKAVGSLFERRTVTEQLCPKLSALLKITSGVTNCFGLGASWLIWGDYFHGQQDQERFFQTTICSALFLLIYTAMLDGTDTFLKWRTEKKGDINELQLLELHAMYKNLAGWSRSTNTNFIDFSAFVLNLPDETRERLAIRTQNTLEGLETILYGQHQQILI